MAALALTACGGAQRQDAHEPSGRFPVAVEHVTFPASQRLAQRTHLVIEVRNTGTRTIPDVAVTICNVTCAYPAPRGQGTSSRAFAADISQPDLANPSRPLWVVDRPPGPCEYSCAGGGPGAAVTAYANTWALGALRPGATAAFVWSVTPVTAGRHVVAWRMAADTQGDTRAQLPDGTLARGRFVVDVSAAPARSHLTASGKVATGG